MLLNIFPEEIISAMFLVAKIPFTGLSLSIMKLQVECIYSDINSYVSYKVYQQFTIWKITNALQK